VDWETTDSLLARLHRFDDEAAWERLAGRFAAPIARFAASLGVPHSDVEDVVQETLSAFALAYREGRYDPAQGRLNRWLFGFAYRQALAGARRSRAKGAEAATGFWDGVPDEAQATRSWDVEWERALLEQCEEIARGEFEPGTFRAYQLVVRGERTPAAAAEELAVPVKSVYNAKHRVLARIREIRERLDREG
jgi:RNA polymerase sigma-70 factor (ECF subfamily)